MDLYLAPVKVMDDVASFSNHCSSLYAKHPDSIWLFPSPVTGEMYYPDTLSAINTEILKTLGLEHLRFHDLRHPYVKHTTKNFVFPYALKSWILYVISMRLSGNTVTRSMSRSMISGVRVSAFRTVFAAA